MRCIVCYRRGPFTGYLDFGVASQNDPVIAEMTAGLDVISIRFW
jgi:hypothetical protein